MQRKLTKKIIEGAKPEIGRKLKLADGGGLYCLVETPAPKPGTTKKPAPRRYWRYKYRIEGKEKVLALGKYPAVPLEDARHEHDKARKLVEEGIDPSVKRKAAREQARERAGITFELVADEWFATKIVGENKSAPHRERTERILSKYLCKDLGARPIADIKPPEVLEALRRIEAAGYFSTAHKARQAASQIFRFAVASGLVERDPTADLKGALRTVKGGHFAAITDPREVGPFMVKLHAYQGAPSVRGALRISPLLLARPGEIRHMEWTELDLEAAIWERSGEKMKTGDDHITPLPRQAVEILEHLKRITGRGRYVFPSNRTDTRPISENTVNVSIRSITGGKDIMTAHGFRALGRTILDEVLEYPAEWIEHQLAHTVRDPNGRAYNRTKYLEQRRAMLQAWADYLDLLRETSDEGERITFETGKEFAHGRQQERQPPLETKSDR